MPASQDTLPNHSTWAPRTTAASPRAQFLALVIAVCALAGFAGPAAAASYDKFSDIDGKRIGVLTGTLFDYLVNATLEQTQLFYYDTIDTMLHDLRMDKLDCIVDDEPSLRYIASRAPRLRVIPDTVKSYDYAMLFRKDAPELAAEFNRELEAMIADGTVAALTGKWLRGEGGPTADSERYSGNKLVRLGVFTEAPPFVYRDMQGNIVGIDIELVEHICRRLKYRLEVIPMSMDALFDSLDAGKTDVVAASISVTNDRKDLGIFGVPYYTAGVTALVREN